MKDTEQVLSGAGSVESFKLDHTKIGGKVPYVRLAMHKKIDGKLSIKKFDIRLCRPNVAAERMRIEIAHSLEHILAVELRKQFGEDFIDISPMGCLTGFYMSVLDRDGADSEDTVCRKVSSALAAIEGYDSVPGAVERECGSYLLHDLKGAKALASKSCGKIAPFQSAD